MTGEMPSRPRQHDISTGSERRLFTAMPRDWVASTPAEDYGVDFDIEVFENGRATGIHFYVQLKATDSLGDSVAVKTTTLNYWKELELPTLLVLHSATSDDLHWKWAHLLELAPNPSADERTIHITESWDNETPTTLLHELKGRRAASSPGNSLPLYIGVHSEFESGQLASHVSGRLRRLPQVHPKLTTVEAKATFLRYDIYIREDRVDLRLLGLPFAHLDYSRAGHDAESMAPVIVGDVCLTMGMQLTHVGLLDIGSRLVAHAVATCSRIWDPPIAAEAAVLLARSGLFQDLISLVRRTYVERETESGMLAVRALQQNAALIPSAVRRTIADEIAECAIGNSARASSVYNAGGLLRHDDFDRSRELYEQAAALEPDYRRRGYWWSEQAATFFHQGNLSRARSYYETAVELGYRRAIPLLADTLLRSGDYGAGLKMLAEANADDALTHPQWRLTQYAFAYLSAYFDLTTQDRDPAMAEKLRTTGNMQAEPDLRKVLESDLLDPFALWAATHIEREHDRPTLPFVLGAAVILLNMPVLWEEALRTAWNHAPEAAMDIIACIKQHCREEFLAFLDEDDFLDVESKRAIAWLIEQTPEPEDPEFELRDAEGRPI